MVQHPVQLCCIVWSLVSKKEATRAIALQTHHPYTHTHSYCQVDTGNRKSPCTCTYTYTIFTLKKIPPEVK